MRLAALLVLVSCASSCVHGEPNPSGSAGEDTASSDGVVAPQADSTPDQNLCEVINQQMGEPSTWVSGYVVELEPYVLDNDTLPLLWLGGATRPSGRRYGNVDTVRIYIACANPIVQRVLPSGTELTDLSAISAGMNIEVLATGSVTAAGTAGGFRIRFNDQRK